MGWMTLSVDGKVLGIVGDKGWDMSAKFVEDFAKMYQEEIGRNPNLDEVLSSIEFVFSTQLENIEDYKRTVL